MLFRLDFVFVVIVQHLLDRGNDAVKRWVNEAQEAVSSDNMMVQVNAPCMDVVWFLLWMLHVSVGPFD